MNLLPMPRSVELGEGTAPYRPESVRIGPALPAQGYRLRIAPDAIELVGGDEAGVVYGQATFDQIRRLHPQELPCLTITDWPDIPVRGVMLDVSRDKVPTLDTLKSLITRLASWKVNHVELYMEHTFAYPGHHEVWAAADPYTPDDIRKLDEHCRSLHVELAANQNCLGHMERWLRHDRYRPLAIHPDGRVDARGRRRSPTTIDPAKPASLALIRELLGILVPSFSSTRVHVGLDEPWELPDERFGDYLDYIHKMRGLPELEGREMLMWGDIVARHPARAADLPADVTVCEWGYEATHPFEQRTAVLAGAGIPSWVCPGTSSWNTLLGRWSNARANLLAAAQAGTTRAAAGYLITDWGDNGHLQYLPVSEPPFAYGAAVSWCNAANHDIDVAAALDVHVFDDATGELSSALLELGDAYLGIVPRVGNMSALCVPLYSPQVNLAERLPGLAAPDLQEVEHRIAGAIERVARSGSTRLDGPLARDEITTSARLLTLLCRDARLRLQHGGRVDDVPAPERAELASELEQVIERHRDLWLSRNRPGGLDDSVGRLERLRLVYRGDGS